MDQEAGKSLRANIFGLTVACPFELDNPDDCPLREIRLLSLRERKNWVYGKSVGECESIHKHHKACLQKKESYKK